MVSSWIRLVRKCHAVVDTFLGENMKNLRRFSKLRVSVTRV